MLIKILKGTYGHRIESPGQKPRIVQKTAKDDPFEVEDELVQRLINLGVATIVADEGEAEGVNYSMTMRKDELIAIAKCFGLEASDSMTKAEIIAALDKALGAADADINEDDDDQDQEPDADGEQTGEEPPKFDAAPLVEV